MRNIRVADPKDWVVNNPPPRPPKRLDRVRDWFATLPILLLCFVLVLPFIPVLAESRPTLAVAPTLVAPGASIRIAGDGFPAKAQGVVTLDGTTVSLGTYSANPRGSFRIKLELPAELSTGDHRLEARASDQAEPLAVAVLSVEAPAAPEATPTPDPTPEPTAAPTATPATTPPTATPTPAPTPTTSPIATALPSPTPTPTAAPITTSGLCSDAIHATYTAVGPDGKVYAAWHPQRDPSGCYFGHDHGSDPSRFAAAAAYAPTFGYVGLLGGSAEPHAGFKNFLIDDGSGHHWLWTAHIGTSGQARVCTRFHSVDLAIAEVASGELLARVHFMGDFGRSESNDTLAALTPANCPTQFQDAKNDGSTGSRQFSINKVGSSSSQYEPWRLDFHQTVFGFDPGHAIAFNTNSSMTTCADGSCTEMLATNHRAAGAFRIVQVGSFSLTAPAAAGAFTCDVLGRTRTGPVQNYIKPGVVIAMQPGRTGYNYWPGVDPNIVDYRQRANDPNVKDGKGDMGAYNIDGQLRTPN